MNVRTRGRKPDPVVDAAIRAAVGDLLFERGFEMTFDEVATRAGVGRASVFRRFATKRDMILEAITKVTVEQVHAPDTGSLRTDLMALMSELMRVFGEPQLHGFARRFLGAATTDPAFTDVFCAYLDRRTEVVGTVLGRAVTRGELPDSTDATQVADLLTGFLTLRLITNVPLPDPDDAEQIGAFIDGLLYGFIRPQSGRRPHQRHEPTQPEGDAQPSDAT